MLFGWPVGSRGTGEESFTLRIPLNVSPNVGIAVSPPEERPLIIEGHPAAIFEFHGYHILEVYSFCSEEAAHELLPKVGAALIWAALQHRIALPFTLRTGSVTYHEPPLDITESDMTRHFFDQGWQQLDGYYPSSVAVIKPEHKRLYVEMIGSPTVTLNIRDQDIVSRLSEAVELPHPERVLDDEKLRLAFNVYSGSFFETSDNARFLILMMVLEVLNPNRSAPEPIKDLVDEFQDRVENIRDSLDETDPAPGYDAYDSLHHRLRDLKRASIRQGIRFLVAETLQRDPEISDPEVVGREAMRIYDKRSTLVHTGWVNEAEVRSGIERLMDIVPRVLSVMFSQAAGDT